MNANDTIIVIASILALGIITCCALFAYRFAQTLFRSYDSKEGTIKVTMNDVESDDIKAKKAVVRRAAYEAGKHVKF